MKHGVFGTRYILYFVSEVATGRSATYDFVLVIYSNHWPISSYFRDKRRCSSKVERNLPLWTLHPTSGVSLEFCNGDEAKK